MMDAGVFGGGAGNANFWVARQIQADSNLITALTNLLLERSGGMSFWDSGQLQDRVYDGTGLHLLSILQLPKLLLNPSQLQWGQVNLLGLTNPISLLAPKRLLYGDVSYWTADDHLTWGDDIYSPEGQHLTWGDNDLSDDYHLTWGDSIDAHDPH
jgi:hypothetical protein